MSQITLFCAYTLIYITRAKSDKDIQPKQSRRSAKATTTFRQNDHDIQPKRPRHSAKPTMTFSQSNHDIPPIAEPPYGVIPK